MEVWNEYEEKLLMRKMIVELNVEKTEGLNEKRLKSSYVSTKSHKSRKAARPSDVTSELLEVCKNEYKEVGTDG